MLVSSIAASAIESPELSEEELRRIRQKDVLSELMAELGNVMPALKRVLIDERDAYLAQKMRETEGERVVAVVGAGHVEGMLDALREDRGPPRGAGSDQRRTPRLTRLEVGRLGDPGVDHRLDRVDRHHAGKRGGG
jgi:pheromone shutdown protein TraB